MPAARSFRTGGARGNPSRWKKLGYDDCAIQQMEESGVLVGNFASMMIASVMEQVASGAAEDTGEEQQNA